MNTYITKKRLLLALALACLAPIVLQNAQAAATFNTSATVTYTINSITNSTNPGSFSGLGIAGSFELAPGQDISTITGDGFVTPALANAGTTALTPANGSTYTRTFQLDGTASNGGEVAANYLAWFGLAFDNSSPTDSYNVGLTLSYELHANVSGDNAFSDVNLNYSNKDESFIGNDYVQAATQASESATFLNSHDINIILASGQTEKLSLDAGISGALQASPVPVPSALWLFSSALLTMPGIKKSKKTVRITD